jgi:hypothetical protein
VVLLAQRAQSKGQVQRTEADQAGKHKDNGQADKDETHGARQHPCNVKRDQYGSDNHSYYAVCRAHVLFHRFLYKDVYQQFIVTKVTQIANS